MTERYSSAVANYIAYCHNYPCTSPVLRLSRCKSVCKSAFNRTLHRASGTGLWLRSSFIVIRDSGFSRHDTRWEGMNATLLYFFFFSISSRVGCLRYKFWGFPWDVKSDVRNNCRDARWLSYLAISFGVYLTPSHLPKRGIWHICGSYIDYWLSRKTADARDKFFIPLHHCWRSSFSRFVYNSWNFKKTYAPHVFPGLRNLHRAVPLPGFIYMDAHQRLNRPARALKESVRFR